MAFHSTVIILFDRTYFLILKMNYRSNNFPSYYENVNPKLGYSNVSKGFGYSNRSTFFSIQTTIPMMTITTEKLNLCLRMRGKSSDKPKTSTNTIWITRER
jgi:hypothetical protein